MIRRLLTCALVLAASVPALTSAPATATEKLARSLTLNVSSDHPTAGDGIRFHGRARGLPARTTVRLQVRTDGHWRTLAEHRTSRSDRYSFSRTARMQQTRFRVIVPASHIHPRVVSPTVAVIVSPAEAPSLELHTTGERYVDTFWDPQEETQTVLTTLHFEALVHGVAQPTVYLESRLIPSDPWGIAGELTPEADGSYAGAVGGNNDYRLRVVSRGADLLFSEPFHADAGPIDIPVNSIYRFWDLPGRDPQHVAAFEATAGEEIDLAGLSSGTVWHATLTDPDGGTVGTFEDDEPLHVIAPVDGTYTVTVTSETGSLGAWTLFTSRLKRVPLTIGGPSVNLDPDRLGQRVLAEFTSSGDQLITGGVDGTFRTEAGDVVTPTYVEDHPSVAPAVYQLHAGTYTFEGSSPYHPATQQLVTIPEVDLTMSGSTSVTAPLGDHPYVALHLHVPSSTRGVVVGPVRSSWFFPDGTQLHSPDGEDRFGDWLPGQFTEPLPAGDYTVMLGRPYVGSPADAVVHASLPFPISTELDAPGVEIPNDGYSQRIVDLTFSGTAGQYVHAQQVGTSSDGTSHAGESPVLLDAEGHEVPLALESELYGPYKPIFRLPADGEYRLSFIASGTAPVHVAARSVAPVPVATDGGITRLTMSRLGDPAVGEITATPGTELTIVEEGDSDESTHSFVDVRDLTGTNLTSVAVGSGSRTFTVPADGHVVLGASFNELVTGWVDVRVSVTNP